MKKKLIIAMLIVSFLSTIVYANDIDGLNKEQDSIQNEIKDANNKVDNINKDIKEKEEEKRSIELDIKSLDIEISEVENEIALSEADIQMVNAQINVLQVEIQTLNVNIEQKQEQMKQVVKISYENHTGGFLTLLLESKGLTNFLKRLDIISNLMKKNKEVVNELKDLHVKVDNKKQNLSEKMLVLEEKKAKLNIRKSELRAVVEQKNAQLFSVDGMTQELKNSREDVQSLLEEKKRQEVEIQDKIKKAIEEENNKQQQGNQGITNPNVPESNDNEDGGNASNNPSINGYLWPSPVSRVITSYFGNRIDPVLGYPKYHNGMDIAAPMGSPIFASASGTVIVAEYSASYGYYVVISHGNGLTTLNAHASSILVSVGQKVERGQQIAKVGSTGWSTGPHIHIEFSVNGIRKDPLDYLD